MDTPAVPSRLLPFPPSSKEEIQEALLRAGNNAPGADEIPSSIIKLAWPLIEDHIYSLFSGYISLGHDRKCFRHASIYMRQKLNKSDLSSLRSYRPIKLLSVLGKGLERLLSKRISWIFTRYKLLTSQQFGALPCRSVTHLTTCLTHDAE